ncbi:MAG: hypothetical protein WCT04_09390 [Planctomycetota bacterium]
MQLTAEQQSFLTSVDDFNARFNTVRTGDSSYALCHPFWNYTEISQSVTIQEDWDVPRSLVPFYGDWHTIICLEPQHGTVQLLNDNRRVMYTWSTIDEFVRCLALKPEEPINTTGIIEAESWLDF